MKNMPSFVRPPLDAILPRNQGNIPISGTRNNNSVPRNAPQLSSASTSYGQNYNLRIFKDPQGETSNPCGVEGEEAGWQRQGPGQNPEKKFYSTERSKMYTETDDGYSTRTDLDKESYFWSNSIEFLFTDHTGTILELDFFVVCGYSKCLEEIEKCTEKIFSFEDTE